MFLCGRLPEVKFGPRSVSVVAAETSINHTCFHKGYIMCNTDLCCVPSCYVEHSKSVTCEVPGCCRCQYANMRFCTEPLPTPNPPGDLTYVLDTEKKCLALKGVKRELALNIFASRCSGLKILLSFLEVKMIWQ